MTQSRSDFGYLGNDFQQRLIRQILEDRKFGERIIDILDPNYFSDKILRIIILEIKNAHEKNEVIPDSGSVKFRLNERLKGDEIEREFVNKQLDKVLKSETNDSIYVQEHAMLFCKQQELKKANQKITTIIEKGDLEEYDTCVDIIKNAIEVGDAEDDDTEVLEGIDDVLSDDYRNPIPTGIDHLDEIMNGGLSRGELAVLLAAYGVGKTTFAVKVANSAHNAGYNVLQLFFEDRPKTIKRKHMACWTGISLDEFEERKEEIKFKLSELGTENSGRIKLKKFPSDGTTIGKVRQYIKKQISNGFKPDLVVLDYIDCVEPNGRIEDINVAQGKVMRGLESIADELNVAVWTFIQGNRSSLKAEVLEGDQMGGSIKRGQIAHFLCSVAKSLPQKDAGTANFAILKSRLGKDGLVFQDIAYDNARVNIHITPENNPISFMDQKEVKEIRQKDSIKNAYLSYKAMKGVEQVV